MHEPIVDWVPTDVPSASHLNAGLPTTRSVQYIQGGANVEVMQAETGTTISASLPPNLVGHFLGIVTDTGPKGESDLTAPGAYWVQIAQPQGGGQPFFLIPIQSPSGQSQGASTIPNIVGVTNIAEVLPGKLSTGKYKNFGSRYLATDNTRYVHVWAFLDSSGLQRYVMDESVSISVIVSLGFSASDASGAYLTSKIKTLSATGFPFMGMVTGDDCMVFNGCEKDLTQPAGAGFVHLLDTNQPYQGTTCGFDPSSGKQLVLINVPPPLDVALTTDGGINGSVTAGALTAQTFTYTVKDLNGNTLMTAAQSTWNRPLTILTGAATHGRIYFAGGTMKLGPTDEMPDYTGCGS